ncbi:MAG TPA: carboxylic acid reductase [Novosphingobium sp.]
MHATMDRAESEQLLAPDMAYLEQVRSGTMPLSRMIRGALEAYAERPALAWRPVDPAAPSGHAPHFVTMSFAELGAQARAIAAFLAHDPATGLTPGDPVVTLNFAGREFVAIDLALGLSGLPIVPLQTNAPTGQLADIVAGLKPRVLCVSSEHLDKALAMAEASPTVTAVVIFELEGAALLAALEQARGALAARGVALVTFAEVLARGAALPAAVPFEPAPGADPLSIVYYTSGSTGAPKGAMYTERLVQPTWAMARDHSVIVLHYQPLNHSFGKSYISMALASGGTTYFTARSDLSTLLDDMAVVRPTTLALVPRVSELLYQRFHAEHGDAVAAGGEQARAAMERFRQQALGGRVRDAVTGAAPLSPELRAFVEELLGFPLVDGYGATELGMVAVNGYVQKPPVIDYKLIDVPELGYFTTDTPHPRGELIVKSQRLFAGYLGQPELTASLIDADGYYYTGDIMEEIEPGRIRYLDRRNNVLKLAQGEFVAVARLESLYAGGHPAIAQIFVYGSSSRSYLLAVVVPNPEVLPPDMAEAEVKARLLVALREVAAANDLQSFEVPRDILVEREKFSPANGLLTGVGKVLRPALKARYGDRLEQLYSTMARQQDAELDALRRDGAQAPVLETVYRAARSVLGLNALDPAVPVSFADLGGDSLSAVSFGMLLEDIYGVPVEAGSIMHPTGDLHQLARQIERDRAGSGPQRATAASLHGDDAAVLEAADLTLDRFIDAATLGEAALLPHPAPAEPTRVLLTGANGFLGRFLCLEWLQRLERSGGRLVCVARGRDDASARARLLEAFATGDPALDAEMARLGDRLEVLAGDLAEPGLGLPEAVWDRLAGEIDLIVHPAALVNHKLPYRQLFGPNVAGTAELIRLALTRRLKRIVNISTIAAIGRGTVDEDAPIRNAVPRWTLSEAYADGYGASKWAGEVLLADAHERFGLPVSNFRSNMILVHSTYRGQLNVPDMFTRWVLSLALTRIAPESFYAGDKARAHYEGLPVDFIARAVVEIGEARRTGLHNFHVLNPHDDGVSLDSFVQWIGENGYPCRRIASYADWVARFETALRALPDSSRQASVLPLMDAFARPSPATPGTRTPTGRFVAAVHESVPVNGGEIPHLGPALIARYIEDLRALGLL